MESLKMCLLFIELLIKLEHFKGVVLIYAEHCECVFKTKSDTQSDVFYNDGNKTSTFPLSLD